MKRRALRVAKPKRSALEYIILGVLLWLAFLAISGASCGRREIGVPAYDTKPIQERIPVKQGEWV